MAIKKGAFELYTQERKLPEKGQTTQTKKSHFFDDSYTQFNGSQTVHSQPDIKILQNESYENNADHINFIGSQTVHDQSSINDSIDKVEEKKDVVIKKDDPLTVQERFTTVTDLHNRTPKKTNDNLENERNIGSQTVHKQFVYGNMPIKTDEDKNNILSAGITENKIISFSRLVGIQREIIIALYKNMRMNKSETTEALNLEMISELSGVNQKSLKNTLFRLVTAGCIDRAEQKNGRGGWVKYRISEHIIMEIQQTDFLLRQKNN